MKSFRLYDSEDHISSLAVGQGGKLVPPNTILILVRGMTLHNDVPICLTTREMAFNQDIKALIPTSNIHSAFLAYWLLANKPDLLATVEHAGHGTGKLTTDRLKEKIVLLPSLIEQEAIASILRALDDKIELNRRMNETLEAMARALFQSWFVNFDPVRAKLDGCLPAGLDPAITELFPSIFQDSELGHIPLGWCIEPIGKVVECVGGGTPSTTQTQYWEGGVHSWTTPRDFSSLQCPFLVQTERKLTDAGISKISSGVLPSGTVLLSSRAPVGYLAISAIPIAINQGFIALKPNGRVSNSFLLNWCKTNMAEIKRRASGTTFEEISKQNFRPIPCVLPSEKLLAAFTNSVEPFYARILTNAKQSRTLAALRDTLLPKLLSGELSVRSLESQVAAVV